MIESKKIKLTVIVTTYNRANKLDRTLAAIHSQTRQPDELIVSDDCSTDDTSVVALDWKDKFKNYRYVRNDRNLYMPGNLNAAMALAGGEYIANLHDADTFHPELLAKWEKALDDYPSAGFVFCGSEDRFEDRRRKSVIHVHEIPPISTGKQFFEMQYVGGLSGPVWGTVMGRRLVYSKLGPYDPNCAWISDVDMRMRMCKDYDVAYVKEPLLVLDNEMNAERKFRWSRLLLHDKIVNTNIRRIFSDDEHKIERLLAIQRNYFRRRYFRIMIGRLYHCDWIQMGVGFRMAFAIFSSRELEN